MSRTTNLTELRRELSRVMREPFFRRIADHRPIAYAAANLLADSALGRFDASEGWPYAFAYIPATGDQREIVNFLSDGSAGYAYVSPNWSTTPGVGYDYEIHSIWSAQEKTDALNHAVHDCWPAFYEILTDETIVIQKWKKEYSLLNLSNHVRHILGVYIEPLWKVDQYRGNTVSSGTGTGTPDLINDEYAVPAAEYVPTSQTNVIRDATNSLWYFSSQNILSSTNYVYGLSVTPQAGAAALTIYSAPHTPPASRPESGVTNLSYVMTPGKSWSFETGKTYEVAVYYGTGAGQYRTVCADDTGVDGFYVTSDFTTALDSTSEFCVKNISDQAYNWQGPIIRYRIDEPESPTMIALHWDSTEYWGARLRIIYATEIDELKYEADAVPDQCADFLVHMAAYHLWLGNIGRGPQFETKTAEKLAQQNKQDAEELRERNRMKRLNGTIRLELDNYGPAMREKPFSR